MYPLQSCSYENMVNYLKLKGIGDTLNRMTATHSQSGGSVVFSMLNHSGVQAQSDTVGTEMLSYVTAKETSCLWNDDPDIWAGHAPDLFPIIGMRKGNVHRTRDKECPCRSKDFCVPHNLRWLNKRKLPLQASHTALRLTEGARGVGLPSKQLRNCSAKEIVWG